MLRMLQKSYKSSMFREVNVMFVNANKKGFGLSNIADGGGGAVTAKTEPAVFINHKLYTV